VKIKDISLCDRPQERLIIHGAKALSDSELLALILRYGTKKENALEISQKIFNNYNIKKLSRISHSSLKKIYGIGDSKASQIIACFELARRLSSFSTKINESISSAEDISELFMAEMSTLDKEHFIGVYLNSKMKIIAKEIIFVGSLNATLVHPREIFKIALTESAAAVILVHNHPSGDPSPSDEDIELTAQIKEAGKILGIDVLDHIIIGYKEYFSFKEKCKI